MSNYVNNKELHAVLLEYKKKCAITEAEGKDYPQLPNYFAKSILLIAERLARKPQFSSYSYVDELQGDAVLACVKYARSYNPEKYENPFAYFTQIIYNAFINRLNTEQAQHYTKALIVKNSGQVTDNEHFSTDSLVAVIDSFETKMSKRKQKEAERQELKAQKKAEEEADALYEQAHSKNRLHTNADMFEGI